MTLILYQTAENTSNFDVSAYFLLLGCKVDQAPDVAGCGAAVVFEMGGHDICSTVYRFLSLWRLRLGTACHENTSLPMRPKLGRIT